MSSNTPSQRILRRRGGSFLLEVLVATFLATTCLMPIAWFLFRSRWNQEASILFAVQGSLDSALLAHGSPSSPCPDSVQNAPWRGYALEVLCSEGPYRSRVLEGRILSSSTGSCRIRSWREVHP